MDLLGLLNWRSNPDDLEQILQRLMEVEGSEIVKVSDRHQKLFFLFCLVFLNLNPPYFLCLWWMAVPAGHAGCPFQHHDGDIGQGDIRHAGVQRSGEALEINPKPCFFTTAVDCSGSSPGFHHHSDRRHQVPALQPCPRDLHQQALQCHLGLHVSLKNWCMAAIISRRNQLSRQHKLIDAKIDESTRRVVVVVNF